MKNGSELQYLKSNCFRLESLSLKIFFCDIQIFLKKFAISAGFDTYQN